MGPLWIPVSDNLSEWPAWPVPADRAPRRALRVGIIADRFTELAFQFEWVQRVLTPENWREELGCGLDLIFVESAWSGSSGAWKYQLTGSKAPSSDLVSLVSAAKAEGIPAVFWNKEDPAHFDDFVDTARLFDWVYTTESALLPEYRERLGHDRIGLLAFAAQQSIHNPIRPRGWSPQDLRGVAFAGTYFRHKYPERREQMDYLLGGAARAAKKESSELDVYSRFASVDPNYVFPDEYRDRVLGELTYSQMLTAYRAYRVFLNVNSIPTSESMCGRRVFEIEACGTPVVSAPTPAISNAFPDDTVSQAGNEVEAYNWTRSLLRSQELRDHLTHLSQRQIWQSHTYTVRVNQVLSDVGLTDALVTSPAVSAMISTNRPHQLEHVFEQMTRQKGVNLELLVGCHGFVLDQAERSAFESRFGQINWVEIDADVPLGDCYNLLAGKAEGEVVAKIDDDDYYGEYYLSEQLAAMDYADADVVGKAAHYMYLESQDATVLRFPETEHKYRPFVSGPTIVAKRRVVLENPFPPVLRGEDTGFLKKVSESGGRIFSTSRFGFMQVRKSGSTHTWDIDDLSILATGTLVAYGKALDHVIF